MNLEFETQSDSALAKEEYDATIRAKYRNLFSGGIGVDVLIDILGMCNFGKELNPSDPEQVIAYNLGLRILYKCGAFEGGNIATIQSMLGVRLGA